MLFDLENDAAENINIAGNVEQEERIKQLSQILAGTYR